MPNAQDQMIYSRTESQEWDREGGGGGGGEGGGEDERRIMVILV